ncbi:ABC transporter ATP-binding protein [Sinorhizobium meliloti]|uniref:ABC transporter ATP-binding protein n=1 Tax=Rhizobium meliloti TaxID=382 RepID=UPI0002861A65|nr:ABC transporter ATP-binding protein [Sinorhizobium meliloti]ASP80087.1 ABC transporter ATP-binding protein [Sinorhizobium meliloti]MDE3799857.1 ABC transporter ATP-binding protein [Sinorhizobium meliloti]MQW15762.1 polyamine ABC transporter ATP-binding protein [Sinorhizobium meliloti]RMI15836.1 ABC transporter ATP-binding protein [Sinorhizobium meliloti]RVH98433.1 ABC transporter ATP-binding protein [Sinorhizobium meliloti]
MSSSKYVEFINVDKSYDGRNLVVDNLNLSIAQGEFLTMLGPSGSGKTTSLMMLAGFEAPSGGNIRIAGRSLDSVPPHRRNIGMVFQNYALFPHMTVAENLDYPLRIRKIARAERNERVRKVLDVVQMGDFAERKPAQLSGGQQQRIALARAIVFEPDVVLMDEPLGALDKNLREHLQFEIKHLHARLGITVVYVTHDQSEALTMSDRVAVFNAGKIEQLAPPAELYERPATPFVAGFIGENNRLTGEISGRDGDEYAVQTETGHRMLVHSSMPFNERQRVIVSVRPERVRLDTTEGCANAFRGTVEEVIYLGDHKRVHVRVNETSTFVAKVPNAGMNIDIKPSQALYLGWDSNDAVLIPA